jgi:ribosome-binding protein aMBF1 (putative translation factor)
MALLAIVLIAGLVAVISCRKSDIRYAMIEIPGMSDARSVRIATNAALHEVVGRFDGIKNDTEIDLSRKVLLYHEGHRLVQPDYQQRIRARIAEVGYASKILAAGLNEPPKVKAMDGNGVYREVQMWPQRCTAVIYVPEMNSQTDANIVVDAIAFARLGRDDVRIEVDTEARRIVATYESMHISQKNIEHAIAYAGLDANRLSARLGQPDSVPNRWTPIKL